MSYRERFAKQTFLRLTALEVGSHVGVLINVSDITKVASKLGGGTRIYVVGNEHEFTEVTEAFVSVLRMIRMGGDIVIFDDEDDEEVDD